MNFQNSMDDHQQDQSSGYGFTNSNTVAPQSVYPEYDPRFDVVSEGTEEPQNQHPMYDPRFGTIENPHSSYYQERPYHPFPTPSTSFNFEQTPPNTDNIDGYYPERQDIQPTAAPSEPPQRMVAFFEGRYVGHLYLDWSLDIDYFRNPPTASKRIPMTLVLEGNQTGFAMAPFQNPENLIEQTTTPTLPPADATNPRKRAADADVVPRPVKRAKSDERDTTPIPPKSAAFYAKAIEEPSGMDKMEGDTCLTCLKQNRRCKGTELELVNGRKRCKNCAKPGKGTSGRVCYWRDPERGIHTFKDGQRIMGKELGGRTLAKNTRQGKLERNNRAATEISDDPSQEG